MSRFFGSPPANRTFQLFLFGKNPRILANDLQQGWLISASCSYNWPKVLLRS